MQRESLLGIDQPSQNRLWKFHIAPGKQGAIDIQNSRFNALRR
ncbi:gamma-glutamyl kinase [Synechococcus sp. WH 5701]|nr:gamma-glutamyl kinase [Synechococcus sp. WH 5701]